MSELYDKLEECLSDADIRRILPGVPIVLYEDLSKYKNLKQLIPASFGAAVVFVALESRQEGHWVCILRDGNEFELFDSYGNRPDRWLAWIDKQQRKKNNESIPYMSYLFNRGLKQGLKLSFNRIEYQSSKSGINTCGRHVCNRIKYMMLHQTMAEDAYLSYMKQLKKDYELSYDLLVCKLIP